MSLKRSKSLALVLAVGALTLTATQVRADIETTDTTLTDEGSPQSDAAPIRNRTAQRCQNLTQASAHLDSMKGTLDRANLWLQTEQPNIRGACTYIGAAKSFADLIRLIPSNDSFGLIDSQLPQDRINGLLTYADDLAKYCINASIDGEVIKLGVQGILTSGAIIQHGIGRVEGAPMVLKYFVTNLKNRLNCQRFGQ